MTQKIILNPNKFVLVDDEDYEWLNQWKWHAHKIRNRYYVERSTWNPKTKKKGKVVMHRLILQAKKGQIIDHINGDSLDNRKCNLRFVTHRQNMQNRHDQRESKFPGVSLNKQMNKWIAHISIDKKRKHLGLFDSELEAFKAYKNAVHELGENLVCELNGQKLDEKIKIFAK